MKDKGQFNEKYIFTCGQCKEQNAFEAEEHPGVNAICICSHCGELHRINMDGPARRSVLQSNIRELMEAIQDVFIQIGDIMTARGVFYQLTTRGAIPKTEKGYDQVCRLLGQMRWRGWIPWNLVVDETRYFMGATTFSNKEQALDHWARSYRRALWDDKDIIVQVYVEKLALAGVMRQITDQYDVELFPMRGFNSLSYSKEIAQQIIANDKHTVLYHFGDYDPSGVCAAETFKDTLYHMGARNFTFERVAVHPYQIEAWDLPTRPTKESDRRAKGFQGESCELDAIEPRLLRRLVESCIQTWITPGEIERIKGIEQEERKILQQLALSA